MESRAERGVRSASSSKHVPLPPINEPIESARRPSMLEAVATFEVASRASATGALASPSCILGERSSWSEAAPN